MSKKNLNLFLFCTAALFSGSLFPVEASAMSGNGSPESPYVLADETDLLHFSSLVNAGDYDACASLSSDISLNGSWTPIGGKDSATAYTGTFLGNEHTVTFSSQTSEDYQGLFGYNRGTIENVNVAGALSAGEYVGGIASINGGTILSCENNASISSLAPVSFAGGIAGVNLGSISESQNTGSISSSASGSNIGGISGAAREGSIADSVNKGSISLTPAETDPDYAEGCAGGITGLNYKAEILRSGNYGSVSNQDASGYTGGIIGLNNGSVSNCVNGNPVTGSYFTGGIAGYNFLNEEAGDARIHNVLNHGTISSDSGNYGAICGTNHNGVIYDGYYLEGTATAGIGTSDNNGTSVKTQAALASGELTYQLNGNQSSDPVWYQNLGSDTAPVLDRTHKVVYRHTENGVVSYTNDASAHTEHEFDETGTCQICDYHSVSLYGHSLTLDGALGMNYYYYLDPMYYQDESYHITVSFEINGRTETASFDPSFVLSTGKDDISQVYGFQLYIQSDEMTSPIVSRLEIRKEDSKIVSLSDDGTFRGYDYLKELYNNQDGLYSQELKALAQALATHDYYANEHFQYQDSYEPEIPLLPLDGVTQELMQPFTQTVEDQSMYTAKHYALSMQFLSEHLLYLYISSEESLDTDQLYMGYKTHGSAEPYVYVQAQKYGDYYRASTEKVPASELDVMWDCAFFQKQTDGSYKQITAVKTAGPLSYAVSCLRPGAKESLKELNQALYLYYEATKTYFDSVSQE